MMFMSSHIYSDLELHARFWVFTAEAAPAKPPEHKITVKELAAFVLQDADNIVKNSKWSVNDNSMYIFRGLVNTERLSIGGMNYSSIFPI